MNQTKCQDCAHYLQMDQYRGETRGSAGYGWCKRKSVFPRESWDLARPFDVDVRRVAVGATRSAPVCVRPGVVLPHCTDVLRRVG